MSEIIGSAIGSADHMYYTQFTESSTGQEIIVPKNIENVGLFDENNTQLQYDFGYTQDGDNIILTDTNGNQKVFKPNIKELTDVTNVVLSVIDGYSTLESPDIKPDEITPFVEDVYKNIGESIVKYEECNSFTAINANKTAKDNFNDLLELYTAERNGESITREELDNMAQLYLISNGYTEENQD